MYADESVEMSRLRVGIVMWVFASITAGIVAYAIEHLAPSLPDTIIVPWSVGLAILLAFALQKWLERLLNMHS